MLIVAVTLPGVKECHVQGEETAVSVFEELREDSPEVRLHFGARWRGIEREREKLVTQKINERGPISHAVGTRKTSSLEFTLVKSKSSHIYQFHRLNFK
jgi:hypothetical protein